MSSRGKEGHSFNKYILISRGEVLTISGVTVNAVVFACGSFSMASYCNTRHAIAMGVFPLGDIVSVEICLPKED